MIIGSLGLKKISDLPRDWQSAILNISKVKSVKLPGLVVARVGVSNEDLFEEFRVIGVDSFVPDSDFVLHDERRIGITSVLLGGRVSVGYDSPERRIPAIKCRSGSWVIVDIGAMCTLNVGN
jgi:hypothetical protein